MLQHPAGWWNKFPQVGDLQHTRFFFSPNVSFRIKKKVNEYSYKPSEKAMYQEVIGPRGNLLLLFWELDRSNGLLDHHSFTHRLVLLSALAREACFCSGQQLTQRFMIGRSAENEWLLTTQPWIGPLSETPHSSCPRNTEEKGVERRQKPEHGEGLLWNTIFGPWHGCCIQELSVVMTTCQDPASKLR